MVKDKCGCMIKEVGDELVSLCLDSLRLSAAGRWTLASLSSSPLSLRAPRHAAPVLVAIVTRASRAMQERDVERKTERGEEGKVWRDSLFHFCNPEGRG